MFASILRPRNRFRPSRWYNRTSVNSRRRRDASQLCPRWAGTSIRISHMCVCECGLHRRFTFSKWPHTRAPDRKWYTRCYAPAAHRNTINLRRSECNSRRARALRTKWVRTARNTAQVKVNAHRINIVAVSRVLVYAIALSLRSELQIQTCKSLALVCMQIVERPPGIKYSNESTRQLGFSLLALCVLTVSLRSRSWLSVVRSWLLTGKFGNSAEQFEWIRTGIGLLVRTVLVSEIMISEVGEKQNWPLRILVFSLLKYSTTY